MASEQDSEVRVPTAGVELDANLNVPDGAEGIVVFVHGSGSSRRSRRNRRVARVLHAAGLATLLMELLTPEEEDVDICTAEFRFNIDLLSKRVIGAVDWLGSQPNTVRMAIGLFGASTGAAAALIAAAEQPNAVQAVVSRGGRPDLAHDALPRVKAPTLLIVGENDTPIVELNREALSELQCEKRLEIIPGATHLFEEAEALDEVARLARDWFLQYLTAKRPKTEAA